MDKFKDRLIKALEIRDLTAAELPRLSGIDEATISNYKKGKYEPKQRKIELLSNALNVSIAWLMGADVPMQKTQYRPKLHQTSSRCLKQKKFPCLEVSPAESRY